MHRETVLLLGLILGNILGNYLFQWCTAHDWPRAWERSCFQVMALLGAMLVFWIVR